MMMRKLLASVALLTTAGLAAGGIVDGMNASTPCQACHGADANSVVLHAARADKPLPNGSIIMVEGATGGATTYYSGMEVREGRGRDVPELLRNGDWGYGLFNAQKVRGEKNNYAMCLACH